MATINSLRPQTKEHHGKTGTPVRTLTSEDGEAFDPAVLKVKFKLDEGGEEITVAHAELLF